MSKPARDPWYVFRDLPCLSCGYNLKTMQGPSIDCPECGHANDLTNPQQWRPQFADGAPFDFATLTVLCLSLWLFPAIVIIVVFAARTELTHVDTWLMILLFAAAAYFMCSYTIKGIRKQLTSAAPPLQLIAMVGLATLVTMGPVLTGTIAYALGLLLTWFWPTFIFVGFGISVITYVLGRDLFPEENKKYRIPPWQRYCDAIKAQAKQVAFKDG